MSVGTDGASAYTRGTMDIRTLGERRSTDVDALYVEAKEVLARAANDVHGITERLRETYSAALLASRAGAPDGAPSGSQEVADLARTHALLSRVEVAGRDLEESWRFLERGLSAAWERGGRSLTDEDDPHARRVPAQSARLVLEAQEQERARLAEELHDGPAQALSNASLQVAIVDRAMRSDTDRAERELGELRRLLERELERLRGFIHQLRPALDEAGGLSAALEEAAETLSRETGMEVTLELEGPEGWLDLAAQGAVLRVAQEALRNVRKHAGAEHVTIATFVEPAVGSSPPSAWVLEVRDDGRGFSIGEALDGAARRHFGLRFMRERAQLIGAGLEIVSGEAGGTTVRLVLDPRERS